jgi:hypothetical protein
MKKGEEIHLENVCSVEVCPSLPVVHVCAQNSDATRPHMLYIFCMTCIK